MTFQEACNKVCGELPQEWIVSVTLMLDSGDVQLIDPEGDDIDFPSNRENVEQTLLDALKHATELSQDDR